jgi:hypothetical protein
LREAGRLWRPVRAGRVVGEAEGLPSGLLGGDNQARVTWVRGVADSPAAL